MTTATEMRQMASMVWRVKGMPKMGTLSRAVKTNSRAAAKAFKMEFNFLRNKLVMMPRIALLKIMRMTKVWLMDANDDEEKALARSP
jgi:hypothetical protein